MDDQEREEIVAGLRSMRKTIERELKRGRIVEYILWGLLALVLLVGLASTSPSCQVRIESAPSAGQGGP